MAYMDAKGNVYDNYNDYILALLEMYKESE